jgi:serine/threonine protein kinase
MVPTRGYGPTPHPGSVVAGRYRIESELGHGGMGAVYRATHVELGRTVALKMVLPEVLGLDEGLARFRREADLAQRLEHPNIVRLYDYGQTEAGLPYIAFELLRGEPLDRAIQAGPMPAARVAKIIIQVLKALMEAHGQGVIHRDIKPPNIFLCEFSGEQDFVKVLDFGIAKSQHSQTLVTQAGLAPGTPNYMAPEQVRGETMTPASDIYAVGLVMAEMLSGRIVFGGAPTDVVMEQISPRPVPLPQSISRSPLWPILVRATEKDLTRRYRSASEMLDDLQAIARSGALDTATSPYVSFRPPPAPATANAQTVLAPRRAEPKKSSALPIVAAFVALVLVSVGGFLVFGRSGDHSDKKPAVSDDDEKEPTKKKKKQKAVDDDDDEPKKIDPKSVKARFNGLGWKILSESTTKQPTMTVTTYTAQKPSQTASLFVYETDDETVLKSLESSLSTKGAAIKRDGGKLYWLLTMPANKTLAEDLLDEITR